MLGCYKSLLHCCLRYKESSWRYKPSLSSFCPLHIARYMLTIVPRLGIQHNLEKSKLFLTYYNSQCHIMWNSPRFSCLYYLDPCYRDRLYNKNGTPLHWRHIGFYSPLSSCISWWFQFCLCGPWFHTTEDKNERFIGVEENDTKLWNRLLCLHSVTLRSSQLFGSIRSFKKNC